MFKSQKLLQIKSNPERKYYILSTHGRKREIKGYIEEIFLIAQKKTMKVSKNIRNSKRNCVSPSATITAQDGAVCVCPCVCE